MKDGDDVKSWTRIFFSVYLSLSPIFDFSSHLGHRLHELRLCRFGSTRTRTRQKSKSIATKDQGCVAGISGNEMEPRGSPQHQTVSSDG